MQCVRLYVYAFHLHYRWVYVLCCVDCRSLFFCINYDICVPYSTRFGKVNSVCNYILMCVSYHSATEFSASLFLLLARSTSNSPRSFQRFRRTLVPNFIQIRQRVKIFPIDPHCKNCPLSATLTRAIFTMGVYGEIRYPLSDLNEIWHQSLSKMLKWSRRVWVWSGRK